MEQTEIKMEMVSLYNLTDDELRRFYTTFALIHNSHLRHPNYNVVTALKKFSTDLKKLTTLAGQMAELEPNNLSAYKFRRFFERHHKLLLELMDKL